MKGGCRNGAHLKNECEGRMPLSKCSRIGFRARSSSGNLAPSVAGRYYLARASPDLVESVCGAMSERGDVEC